LRALEGYLKELFRMSVPKNAEELLRALESS